MSGPQSLRVPIKRLAHAQGLALPAYGTADSAGCDLRAAISDSLTIEPLERQLLPTGLSIALPKGYEGQVRPRSGLAVKQGITVLNAPGTIDADYRGEIMIPLINLSRAPVTISRGDRIAQLVIAPYFVAFWDESSDLEQTDRGLSGFGSTGTR